MDYNVIVQTVSSVGFPIVMCLMLYNQMLKTEEVHKQEIAELRKAIENNTIALNNLSTRKEV
ncbi:MAG: YvrJ protein family protein [Bacteriophage sp.]|nr:MAG: YvrJ protein family protein [Bacteriophage sp.]